MAFPLHGLGRAGLARPPRGGRLRRSGDDKPVGAARNPALTGGVLSFHGRDGLIQPIAPRHSQGRGWVLAHVALLSAGDPLADWGHFTPRYPTGIGNKALERAPQEIQRETALFWFHLNLIL